MKTFEVYKNIRKQAVIFGLPVSLFALMMISIVTSLLVIIFSFSFIMILGVLFFNSVLYTVLLQITNHPQLFQGKANFPDIISIRKYSGLHYEED